MNVRTIGIGIVAVALILAISMTASANPDPTGATDTVQSNNVTLGTFNVSGAYADANELGEGVSTGVYAHPTVDMVFGAENTHINYTISYTKEDGSTGTTNVTFVSGTNNSTTAWISISVADLVDVTNITVKDGDTAGNVTTGNFSIVATVQRQALYQGVGGTDVAKGGFVTEMDLSTESRTAKWQGYYGNVSGSIVLADSQGHDMFTWDWDKAKGGEVIATTNTSMPPWASVTATDATNMTTMEELWLWDSGTSDGPLITFENKTDNVTIAGVAVTLTNGTSRLGTSDNVRSFTEVVLTDGASAAKEDFLFVGIINAGKTAFDGTAKDFEMLVATPDTGAAGDTETYYFYVEMT